MSRIQPVYNDLKAQGKWLTKDPKDAQIIMLKAHQGKSKHCPGSDKASASSKQSAKCKDGGKGTQQRCTMSIKIPRNRRPWCTRASPTIGACITSTQNILMINPGWVVGALTVLMEMIVTRSGSCNPNSLPLRLISSEKGIILVGHNYPSFSS